LSLQAIGLTRDPIQQQAIVSLNQSEKQRTEGASVEFVYTYDELKMMEKWKNKTLAEMYSDALSGDPAALHMVGLSYLYGFSGLPINIKYANLYFAQAASLGFAPALDKMTRMYLENTPNPFLAMVYANLVISFGHPEFIVGYHNQRNKMLKAFGPETCERIERIAAEKKNKILDAMNRRSESKNYNPGLERISSNITIEDVDYDLDYWCEIATKEINNKRDLQ
jgi:TPR repeat protein